MATLTDNVKAAIVQALACYETPSQVVEAVKAEFGVDISRQQCQLYDPNKSNGASLAKKWRDLFAATREAFLKDSAQIGISHRAVRLRRLDRMSTRAEERGNIPLAAQLIEQAAKEVGDIYTNRREHTGKNGGPMEYRDLSKVPDEDLAKSILTEVLGAKAAQ